MKEHANRSGTAARPVFTGAGAVLLGPAFVDLGHEHPRGTPERPRFAEQTERAAADRSSRRAARLLDGVHGTTIPDG
jgi:hypothetical protein